MTERSFPVGLAPEPAVLIDERRRPDFRDLFGTLAGAATRVATAVTHVRLSTLDLTEGELRGVRSLRVLLAELNALRLDAEARALLALPGRARTVRLLSGLLERGVLEVRSAPLGGWSPDFSVFGTEAGATAVLLGPHWFQRPYPHRGPALASLHGPEAARLALRRHEALWEDAHDVGPAIWSLLARADARSRAGADPWADADPPGPGGVGAESPARAAPHGPAEAAGGG